MSPGFLISPSSFSFGFLGASAMPAPIIGAQSVDNEVYIRIGRVAAEWSYVEMLLSEMLAHFCHADPGSMYVITQDVSIASVTSWLRTLTEIQVKEPGSRKVLIDLLNEIDDVRARRNIVVHGAWSGHDTPGFAFVSTIRWSRSEVARSEMWSTDDFGDLLVDMADLQTRLAALGIGMGFLRLDE